MTTTQIDEVAGIVVYKSNGRITFTAGLMCDGDGSPRCYGPHPLIGLDYLENAGNPDTGEWWGIAVDEDGEPYIQKDTDPSPGYYVSTTSLEYPKYDKSDTRRYVNAEVVPYIVLPIRHYQKWGVRLGAKAKVSHGGITVDAIFADGGPPGKIGEGSIALAKALGINPDPKHGGTEKHTVVYSVECSP